MILPEPGLVVGRLAPSPTGVLHLGNVRTFMWAWLAARSAGGRVILRIEDLEKPLSGLILEDMLSDLRWLGFDWDEGLVWTESDDAALQEIRRYPRARAQASEMARELSVAPQDKRFWISAVGRRLPFSGPAAPYIQSQRSPLYIRTFEQLQAAGHLYPCSCERAEYARALGAPHADDAEAWYPGTCRQRPIDPADARCWRFRVPDDGAGKVVFGDILRGECWVDVSASVGDFPVFKTPQLPMYQLAVVVDDLAMGVNQVVRGDDLIPSTARQILLLRALKGQSACVPSYGHVPLVLGPDGRRIAKRHGDARLHALREQGIDPKNILGVLAEWSGLGRGRATSLADLVDDFNWASLNRARVIMGPDELLRLGMASA